MKQGCYKAYSMIELILVILVIAILAVFVLPVYFTTEDYALNAYYKDALSTLRYAQRFAVGMGCDVQVSHTSNTISLNLRQNCTTGSFNISVIDPGTTNTPYTRQAPGGVTVSSINFPLYFDPVGRAHLSSTGVVSDAQMQINTKTINIDGETGYAYQP